MTIEKKTWVNYNRATANNTLDYKRQQRDAFIDQNGIFIDIVIPLVKNVDAYGDLVYATNSEVETVRSSIIPKYNQWRMLIDIVGLSTENPVPLEIIVRSDFDYPRGTKLLIPVDDRVKEWKVLSSSVNHLDYTHDKIVKVVPWRFIEDVEENKVELRVQETAENDKTSQGYEF